MTYCLCQCSTTLMQFLIMPTLSSCEKHSILRRDEELYVSLTYKVHCQYNCLYLGYFTYFATVMH